MLNKKKKNIRESILYAFASVSPDNKRTYFRLKMVIDNRHIRELKYF